MTAMTNIPAEAHEFYESTLVARAQVKAHEHRLVRYQRWAAIFWATAPLLSGLALASETWPGGSKVPSALFFVGIVVLALIGHTMGFSEKAQAHAVLRAEWMTHRFERERILRAVLREGITPELRARSRELDDKAARFTGRTPSDIPSDIFVRARQEVAMEEGLPLPK